MKYSLHIGINKYNPAIYGYGNDLNACVFDAHDMWCLAEKSGVSLNNTVHLLDENATVENFKKFIIEVAMRAVSGDTFILTYSCHGTQIYDKNGDESDKLDEAICLHNGIIYDDELSELLSKFKKGVLVLIYADTCHSETQFRLMNNGVKSLYRNKFVAPVEGYHKNNKSRGFTNKINCKVIEFAACKANQTALDGKNNGYFTEHVLFALNSLSTSTIKIPTYKTFFKRLVKLMGETQVPALTIHNIPVWSSPKIF